MVSSRRPTKYSEKLAKEICADLISGLTIKKACKKNDIHHSTYYAWLEKKSFQELVKTAREISGYRYFEKAHSVLLDLEKGKFDHYDKTALLDENDGIVQGKDGKIKLQKKLSLSNVKKAALLFNGYVRLAGKANQNTFGNKLQVSGKIECSISDKLSLFKKRTKKIENKTKIKTQKKTKTKTLKLRKRVKK